MTMRIVSLVPSLTQTVCALGRQTNIVGCTQFCVRPADLHRKAVLVGGTKDPNLSMIADLAPSLILVNSEENRAEDIQKCRSIANVIETFPRSPVDVPLMLRTIGDAIEASQGAERLAADVEAQLQHLQNHQPGKGLKFAYFIWKNPYMLAASDTYISRSLEMIGLRNTFNASVRYPSVQLSEVDAASPDIVLLSTEPYPFRQRDVAEIRTLVPSASEIYRIDGQLMSWFGGMTCDLLGHLEKWPNCDQHFLRKFS